jgi:hypothetical protein
MKTYHVVRLSLVAAGSCLLAAGCAVEATGPGGTVAVAPGEVYVESAPPPVVVEAPTPVPGPGFVWVTGGWNWIGGRWVWEHGRWDRPPYHGAHWYPGRYVYRGGHHVYMRGGWR